MKIMKISAILLLFALLCGMLIACTDQRTPTGMQDVTAPGQDFMLFVPMTWTSNSRSGVSGAYYTTADHAEKGEDLSKHAKYWTITAQKVEDDAESIDAYWEKLHAYYAEAYEEYTPLPYKEPTEQKPEGQLFRNTSLKVDNAEESRCAAQVYEFTAKVKEFAPTQDQTAQGSMTFVRKYCQVICRASDGSGFYVLTYSAREEDYATFVDLFIHELPENTVVGEFLILTEKSTVTEQKLFADPDTSDDMIPASTNEMPYRFYVPETWRVGNTTEYPSAFAPSGSANVTVTIYTPSNAALSVDEYWQGYCLPEYEAVFDTFDVSEQVWEGTIGVEKETKNAKTYTFEGTIGGKTYQYKQTVIVHSSLIYCITYTALASDGSFAQYEADYQAMLDSFTFR